MLPLKKEQLQKKEEDGRHTAFNKSEIPASATCCFNFLSPSCALSHKETYTPTSFGESIIWTTPVICHGTLEQSKTPARSLSHPISESVDDTIQRGLSVELIALFIVNNVSNTFLLAPLNLLFS